MRGSKHIHGSRAKRRGYHSQQNGTPSCWANFSRCLACMAISYRTLIWLRWLWSTGRRRWIPYTVVYELAKLAGLQLGLRKKTATKPDV